jgi:predicted nucleotidyltransferase
MLTKKELAIFHVFVRFPFRAYTLKQIKLLSKEKSNNALNIAMKQFKKESLLEEQKVGKSSLYTLNLDNDLVYCYIALANHSRSNMLVRKTIKIIKDNVEKCTKFYSIVIFGSYATQEQKDGSDFDVAVFIEGEGLRKEVNKALRSAALKSVLNIDGHVITKDEFLEMLRLEEENLGKQIARKHMAVHNPQIFYAVLKEGIRYGSRI